MANGSCARGGNGLQYMSNPVRYPCDPKAHTIVKECMTALSLSGRELGKVCAKAGVNPGTVANWRNGKYAPNLFLLDVLVQELGYALTIEPNVIVLPHSSLWLRTKNTPGY